MIPALVVGFGVAALTIDLLSGAAAAGAGYGIGRKYGRKLCQAMDGVESKVTQAYQTFK
ncbi:MAG: hypothetical protein QNL85_01410 [Euryarchaeota archaeon]